MVVVGSECSAGTVCGLHSMPGKVGIFIYNRWDVGSDGRGRGAAIKKKNPCLYTAWRLFMAKRI